MDELSRIIGINLNLNFVFIFGSLIFVRMMAVVSFVPFLFAKPVPRQARIGAAFIFTIFAYMHLVPANPPVIPEDVFVIVALFFKEIFIGLLIGFTAGIIFYGFECAGQMIDNQRGMSIARILIPELGQQSSIIGSFLFQLSIVVFLAIGGHLVFLNAVFSSFDLIPLFEFPKMGNELLPMLEFFIRITAEVILIAVQIAAPVIIAILISDIILGVANRIAPQINVWELGFNIKGYLGILALFWAITVIVTQVQIHAQKTGADLGQLIDMLRGATSESTKELSVPEEPKAPANDETGRVLETPAN